MITWDQSLFTVVAKGLRPVEPSTRAGLKALLEAKLEDTGDTRGFLGMVYSGNNQYQ